MASHSKAHAWIETPEGQKIFLGRKCSVGRSSSNDLVLKNEKISRKHALIHTQDKNEYWLVDFGSSNGTRVNGRRITHPTRLQDKDKIEVAEIALGFRQVAEKPAAHETSPPVRTASYETRTTTCWLLLADIVSSSQLTESHSEKELPMVIGTWFLECKQLIETNGGTINKFLGDGFFAYWLDDKEAPAKVMRAIAQLKEAQKNSNPPFRVALHHGEVSIGGSPLMLEEIIGRSVNFAFRMEKLAAKLQTLSLLSAAAKERLPKLHASPLGEHPVAGFEGEFHFYSL